LLASFLLKYYSVLVVKSFDIYYILTRAETIVDKAVSIMPKVKVNDVKVYYEARSEGFPLMMIMGLSANVDWWDPRMLQGLSKKFKLIMFDNRGAGRTGVSDRRYTVKSFAEDTTDLMNVLGISRAHVIGVSMGGMIAQELALNFPEKVEKLVLCSTNCGGARSVLASQEVLQALTADRSALSPEEIVRMTIPLLFTDDFIEKNPDLVELSIQRILRAPISNESFVRQLNAIMEFDTYDRLPQIRASTLILHGKRDILVPPENAVVLAEAIPNAKLIYFENSAHGLVEEMEKVVHVLLDFLTES
jgi:pimeloyl-ACP methyl ester carboxylesterase